MAALASAVSWTVAISAARQRNSVSDSTPSSWKSRCTARCFASSKQSYFSAQSALHLAPIQLDDTSRRAARAARRGVTAQKLDPSAQPQTSGRGESVRAAAVVLEKGLETGASEESSTEAESAFPAQQIWLSDVVGKKKRPYFLGRSWSAKDITIGLYLAAMHGLCLFAPFTFSWDAFACFGTLYIITGMLGITLSYHRNLSHKSFKLPKWLEYTFAYCGVQAAQGSPLEWVSSHRYHHQHCDTPQDPHTPYEGFWHSHMGWILDDKATDVKVGERGNIADMVNDPFYQFIEKTYMFHIIGAGLLLYLIGGFPWVVWGMGVRLVWVYHITWFVNSAAHVWGYQSWNTGDLSRNNWWVALLAFGEGWHNNHHAFEYSARHGLEWWQLDVTWLTVKALESVGLASKVRYPAKEHMVKMKLQENS